MQAVGGLHEVLAALADPIRLSMVAALAHEGGGPVACARLYDGISKSTASHHFKVLREAGVIRSLSRSGQTFQELRLDDVEAAHPGLLRSVIAAQESER